MAAESGLLFFEWSCAEGSSPHDESNWAVANPSMGVHGVAPVEFLRADYELNMSLQQFAREHLGMWTDPAMSSIISFDLWNHPDVVTAVSPEYGDIAVSVDVAPDKEFSSISVAQAWPDGRHHVEVVESDKGVNWVLPCMQRLIASSNPPKSCVLQASGRAAELGPELEQMGYSVKYFGKQDIADSTQQLERDLEGQMLTHLDDPTLLDGLAGAAKYHIGNSKVAGGWGFLRKNTSVDLTGIVSCCYANRALTLVTVAQSLARKKKYRMA